MLSSKILRHFLAPLVLLTLTALMIAQSSRGEALARWDQLLDMNHAARSKKHVKFSALLPGGMGAPAFERDADDVLPPSGLTQLFVAGAALEKLGPEFRFETRVEWRRPLLKDPGKATDLTLIGNGDPSWGMPEWNETAMTRFEQIAQILYDQGVEEIHGAIQIVSADRVWDEAGPSIGWLEQDFVTCDGAYPHSVNVALNCATLVVEDPSESYWQDSAISVPVKLDLEWGDKTVLRPELDGEGFRIHGTWANNTRPTEIRLPIRQPREWAMSLLELALRSRGIKIQPRSPLASTSGRFALIDHSATIHSPPLRELLKPMLKNANGGLIAESLFIALGRQDGLRQYLNHNLPDERTVSLWDGSGLSRSNTASAREILSLLRAFSRSPNFGRLWDALSIAGVDGTLSDRMRGGAAEGVLRAKTGTLQGHSQIAGYVPRFDGAGQVAEYVPFVILSQSRNCRAARTIQDRVGEELVRAVND